MKLMQFLKKNKLLAGVLLAYLLLFLTMPDKAESSVKNSLYYILEMLQIMPVVFILTSILEAWVPKELIISGFGEKAGIRGGILSFALGSLSAGPIYAAFPISKMLLKKGASVANIVIILSAWAVIKVPMLANEAKFLGPRFMGVRWILTTIAIFTMAYLTSLFISKDSIPISIGDDQTRGGKLNIMEQYCLGCGVCTRISPKHFRLENKKAVFCAESVKSEDMEDITKAIAQCPYKAICL